MYYGPGAGQTNTATSVLADIINVLVVFQMAMLVNRLTGTSYLPLCPAKMLRAATLPLIRPDEKIKILHIQKSQLRRYFI